MITIYETIITCQQNSIRDISNRITQKWSVFQIWNIEGKDAIVITFMQSI